MLAVATTSIDDTQSITQNRLSHRLQNAASRRRKYVSGKLDIISAVIEAQATIARQELNDYLNFVEGWDGYCGQPIDLDLVRTAQSLLDLTEFAFKQENAKPKEITPGPVSDGSINIELTYKDKYQLFGLHSGNLIVDYYWETGETSGQEQFELTVAGVESRLAWLFC